MGFVLHLSELRKYPLPVASGCGAFVLLKYIVLESTGKYDDASTLALFFFFFSSQKIYSIEEWCMVIYDELVVLL